MKYRCGSLYKSYLVLYPYDESNTQCVVFFDDEDLQWEMYCNDVEVIYFDIEDNKVKIIFDGFEYLLNYQETDNPMQTLGFCD